MKKFVFETVEDAIKALDVSVIHTKIKTALGLAWITKEGAELRDAEQRGSALLNFIESGDLKRELERRHAEHGRIDLTEPEGEDGTLLGDYFDSMIMLRRLHASWTRRAVTSSR